MSKYSNIVLRTGVDIFRPYLNKLEKTVAPSSIKYISPQTSLTELNSIMKHPFFSDRYIVYASLPEQDDKYISYLAALCKTEWVQLIIKVPNKLMFDNLKYDSRFSRFKFLDCYNVKKEVIEAYIVYVLKQNGCNPKYITQTAVTRIRRRAKYRLYVLDSVLPILAKTNLSERVVNSYIAPYTGVTLQNIGYRFFEPGKSKVVAEFLLRYRFYIDNIFKSVKAYVEDWLKLYDEYVVGSFSEETLIDWIDQHGEKYSIHYAYEAERWLSSFRQYSFDFMMLVYLTLLDAVDSNNNIQLLSLYKVFRMVNNE